MCQRFSETQFIISNGTDIRTIAERLGHGHANANTPAMIYSHHLKQAALALEILLLKGKHNCLAFLTFTIFHPHL